jgi:predicted ATPase
VTSSELSPLPKEYQHLIHQAQERHDIEVVLLDELKGGRTGALLYLVSVSPVDAPQVEHFILKLDRVHKKATFDEIKRHTSAVDQAPVDFGRAHMAELVFEVKSEGQIAVFYTIAGQSLHQFQPLAHYERQSQLETIFSTTNDKLLNQWNAELTFEQAVHPQSVLNRWLGYRLKSEGNLGHFLEDVFQIDQNIPGLLIQDQVFPNPLIFGRKIELWVPSRPIDIAIGFQHGDLNIGNILVKFTENEKDLDGYFLIDFALFKSQMPLLFDQRYLELSFLIRELERASFSKWVNLVTRFANHDMPDPLRVPIELSGACAVINAGREAYRHWVQVTHASLNDDLWGQFWLAGVAAGLNYCNKATLPNPERLAGLIYAAAHLKRYCSQFGATTPSEVSLLYDGETLPEQVIEAKQTELIYQVVVPDLPAEFPPLPTVSLQDRILPEHVKPLVGRQRELAQVALLLHEHRLITLCGPGGIGKTRLALAVAEAQAESYRQGAHFVSLLSLNSPTAIAPSIGNVLGLTFLEGRAPQDQLLDYLRTRQMLLVLDNMEHLLIDYFDAETLSLVEAMLSAAAELTILVTSRELLRLPQEHAYQVQGLPVGDKETEINEQSATELFCLRAQDVLPSFKLERDEHLRHIHQLCRLVEGMPLAIELAAAQLRLLSLSELSAEIKAGLDVLDTGMRGADARHANMRVVFETTWRGLKVELQRIFARLSVFQGGFTPRAASQVAQATIPDLATLLDKSLLQRNADDRFGFHALIQMFAHEKLVEISTELDPTLNRHYQYYRQMINKHISRWQETYDNASLDPIKPEVDNLRAGWDWIVSQNDWDEVAAYMDDLWHFFKVRGRLPEAMELINQALQAGQAADPAASNVYLAYWERRLGQAYLWLSQLNEGEEHFRLAVSYLERPVPDSRTRLLVGVIAQLLLQVLHRAWPGYFIGRLKNKQASLREAFFAYERLTERAWIENKTLLGMFCGIRSINLAEAAGLRPLMAQAYGPIAYTFGLMRLHRLAQAYLNRAQAIIQQQTSTEVQESVWMMTGLYYSGVGEIKRAEEALARSADLSGLLGKHWVQGNSWALNLVLVYQKGEFDRCLEFAQKIGNMAQQSGDLGFEAAALYWEAVVKLQKDELDGVVSLLEESASYPAEVMNRFDWIILHSALARAYCRLEQLDLAKIEADKTSKFIAEISYPVGYSYLYGYAGVVEVYLTLWEMESNLEEDQGLKASALRACKNLQFFAKVFPLAKPDAWRFQGLYDWQAGEQRKAFKAWQKSLAHAQEQENLYQQGLTHYEIGRHLSAGEKTSNSWGSPDHLQHAAGIFADLGATYDHNRANAELENLDRPT